MKPSPVVKSPKKPKPLADDPPVIIHPMATPAEDSVAMMNWLIQNQATSAKGLVADYPEDPRSIAMPCGQDCWYYVDMKNEAFTYSQATAGLTMLAQGDTVSAQKIFNFYNNEWSHPSDNGTPASGFFTVYDKNFGAAPGTGRVEYNKIMSPTAWVAIFSLRYYSATGDANALALATNIGKWIKALPHDTFAYNGGVASGVAMGAGNAGTPNYGTIYSVENNLTYYGLLRTLSAMAASASDRQSFAEDKTKLKNWLVARGYDPAAGLFRRSPTDTTNFAALDSNTWAIEALGVAGVKELLNFNDAQFDAYVRRIETTFAVQNDGTFGGNVLTAKGFDFSDAQNAARIRAQGKTRPGIVWVEGTNQMIQSYKLIADYYQSLDPVAHAARITGYRDRAAHFEDLNINNGTLQNGQLSYTYSDRALTQIWSDDANNKTSQGAALDSVSWVYFSLNNINPFTDGMKLRITPANVTSYLDGSGNFVFPDGVTNVIFIGASIPGNLTIPSGVNANLSQGTSLGSLTSQGTVTSDTSGSLGPITVSSGTLTVTTPFAGGNSLTIGAGATVTLGSGLSVPDTSGSSSK